MSEQIKDTLKLSEKISPEAKEEILGLDAKIKEFRSGKMDADKFKAHRLSRGIYGQRQEGVQMVRIKLPFGRVLPHQIHRIADISDEFAAHNLHLTTRQDIQIHFVKLENTPKVWSLLAEVGVTTREACGNTVRNITASSKAGIDPNEPFDVTPYAYNHFKYFLRNPICQEMGRKFKMSFSSSDEDSAYGFIHDLGFIPKIKIENGVETRGFKVLIGGGLGAQGYLAQPVYEFLPEDQIIPFSEVVIRVFDRYGERQRRNKARMKFLVSNFGVEEFMKLVQVEWKAVKNKSVKTDITAISEGKPSEASYELEEPKDKEKFQNFLKTNVFEQKQKGFYGVNLKVFLGDVATDTARTFADIVSKYASEDIRITVNQGFLLRFVKEEALPALFNALDAIGLAEPGFDSTGDITACPGTDTCNLGISSSTGIAVELERVIHEEFPELIFNNDIKIKISGCMNACAQHSVASIGLHGMSIKKGDFVLPAMQLMLGGGIGGDGKGYLGDKVIKLPSKRIPQALRIILNDYEDNALEGEYFNNYYRRQLETDKLYFFKMLKILGDLSSVAENDYIDWGHEENYIKAIGVGECAGVMIDLVATLIEETEEKYAWAERAFAKESFADAIYNAYNSFITGAKAVLISENINCNTQIGILNDFEEHFVKTGLFQFENGFQETVLALNKNEPTKEFALAFLNEAKTFQNDIIAYRQRKVTSKAS